MSAEGLKKVAAIFSLMQQTRIDLIGNGAKSPIDKQDLFLGTMLLDGKDSMKEKFNQATICSYLLGKKCTQKRCSVFKTCTFRDTLP